MVKHYYFLICLGQKNFEFFLINLKMEKVKQKFDEKIRPEEEDKETKVGQDCLRRDPILFQPNDSQTKTGIRFKSII